MHYVSIALTGFSIISAAVLMVAYLFFLHGMRKTYPGLVACVTMLLGLGSLQCAHMLYFVDGVALLEFRLYGLLLALLPVAFLFFSREVLFLNNGFQWREAGYLLPIPLSMLLPLPWVPLFAFSVGCLYTFLIVRNVATLRRHTGRFKFEMFFFGLFFLMALIALVLGLVLPYLDQTAYYHGYANSISLAMILVIGALLIFPELLSDILLMTESAYAKSRLVQVDTELKLAELDRLMSVDKCYEDEDLNLSILADAVGLTGHQLSELINSEFGFGFPRFVREHRVRAARDLLVEEPHASVLSVGLSVGFRSQSSFYSAFKQITGQSPGGYRKAHGLQS